MDEVEYHVESVTGGMADLVSEVWHLRHGGDESPQMIAPDGCCEIILHRGTPPLERSGDSWVRQSDAFLYGPLNRALTLRLSGPMDVLGIRLHPWAVGGLGRDPSVWRNRSVALDTIIGPGPSERLLALARQAASPADFLTISTPLLDDCLRLCELPDDVVDLVSSLRGGDAGSIRQLATRSGLGERTIRRRFERACGLPAGDLVGIFRFHRAREAIKAGRPLSEVADLAGYADQAHMTRDFRRFAGITPVPARKPAAFDVLYQR